jgi:hypothetical protein
MTRAEALIVRGFAVWTVWVWGTRIANIMGDANRSSAFKAVHVTLAAISVALAFAALVVVSRVRRRAADR